MTKDNTVVRLEKNDDIALVRIDNPPVNALSYAVRRGIHDCIEKADSDDDIKAIIIICAGRTFCAGADIKEFGQPLQPPGLGEVLNRIDGCSKPVIAAIHGTTLGGGLETALACHFRVALVSTGMGLPEVKLGLIPGAGGTQRLPRVVGVQTALEMIASGKQVSTDDALEAGLVDEIVTGDLETGALAFSRRIIAENRPLKRISERQDKIRAFRDKPTLFDDFRKALVKRTRGFDAPEACVKAVEAAVNMPFAEGLAYERSLFEELMAGTQSAAQRYYFFAERQTAKIPDIPKDTPTLEIRRAAVIGAGTMGGGIAMNFVNAGIPVTLVETSREFLDRGLGVIRKNYDISAARGKVSGADVKKRMGLITGAFSLDDVADADIVIEAVFENMDLKKEIFTKLDRICRSDAIMATNTSYLDVNAIAAVTSRPENVLGLHFFSPANVMRLIEIVRAEKTSKTVLATSLALAKKINKLPVVVGVCYGFAGNRMFAQRKREADALILEGAFPSQVDNILYDFGFPMGPFALYDLIGLDLGWRRETSSGSTIKERLCEMGRLGQKSGAGYYNYEANSRTPVPDPEIEQLIRNFAKEKNIPQREISDREIIERCIYPIINEGARILEEGIAARAGDLDVIWVNGYGWPVYRGGPMFYADTVGLDKVLETLQAYHARFGDTWKPAALIEKLVEKGHHFQRM